MRGYSALSQRGETAEETAAGLNVGQDTVLRDWKLAQAWLLERLDHA